MTPRASGVVSVIVPVLNEEDNIPELVRRLKAALDGGLSCDIIFVDDGSTDRTGRLLTSLHVEDLRINSTEDPQI
jgi:polyisoprenyl-phosphate glycosyltransferase